MRVLWTRLALIDLEAIGDYIGRENPTAAARVVTAILDQAQTLASFPDMGRAGRIAGTRELVIAGAPFVIPYRVRDSGVEILAVFHASRKWPESLD
jgi:toxin ParE1/3/4